MTFKHQFLVAAPILLALFAPATASAATRTVCYRIGFLDDRLTKSCAGVTETGALRGCRTGGSVGDAVGHFIELWDKDSTGADEFIKTVVISGEGRRCHTFEWEGSSVDKGEANPDVYIKMTNEVSSTDDHTPTVEAKDGSGSSIGNPSWRNGPSGDTNKWVAVNCTTAAACDIRPGKILIPSGDVSSDKNRRAFALDTAQHMLQVFTDALTSNIKMRFPVGGTTSFTSDRNTIHIDNDDSPQRSVAHELGHALQMQQFGQDDLRDVCDGSHSVGVAAASDSCATTEGWADFVTGASWWDPGNTGSLPRHSNFNLETAAPVESTCADNARIEGQVARGFWDLLDSNNEGGSGSLPDDDLTEDVLDITAIWGDFPNGTGDEDDFESDDDGVNIWDYFANAGASFGSTATLQDTLIEHNCLDDQDTN